MNDWELTKRLIANSAARFARETAGHKMEILHDDGLYRHVKFGDSFYWFELITAPRSLVFRGDGTSFVFHVMDDMFDFFRRSGRGAGDAIEINPQYWEEKLTSDRKCVRVYSSDLFELQVNECLGQAEKDFPGVTAEWTEKTEGFLAEYSTDFEETAREALRDFQFGELEVKVSCSCGESFGPTTQGAALSWRLEHATYSDPKHKTKEARSGLFTFGDTSEWNLQDFDWWYLWACHAIVDGIRRYDAAKAEQAASQSPRAAVRNLVAAVEEAAAAGPCWVLRSTGRAALIGPDGQGGHRFVAGFHRRTLTEAQTLGLVQLGDTRGPVPQYSGGGKVWEWDGGALEGRRIALSHVDVATGGAS